MCECEKSYVNRNQKVIKERPNDVPKCNKCEIPAEFVCTIDNKHLFCAKHAPCTMPVTKAKKCPQCSGDMNHLY